MTEQVYIRVDGKLIPKPGDQRDPQRRYSHVSDAGRSYVVEFTAEEEAQRDAEEAKWEAEKPEREARRKEEERQAREFRASIKYEPKLCAFLDVLGWRQAIERSATNAEIVRDLGVTLSSLQSRRRVVEWQQDQKFPGGLCMTQFSDCIVMSATADPIGKSTLISFVHSLCWEFLFKGLLLRGGIVRGPLYHTRDSVFGPALVEAYEIEKAAKFPRIVLEEELARQWWPGERVRMLDGSVEHFRTWRKCWTDEHVFLDFLQPVVGDPGIPVTAKEQWVRMALDKARHLIERHINDPALAEKYTWLALYHDGVAEEYSVFGIPRIVVAD